jgi:phage shock protein A
MRAGRSSCGSTTGRRSWSRDARAYQMLWELVDRIETIEAVREGLEQLERGEGRPLEKVVEDLGTKHRLPRPE